LGADGRVSIEADLDGYQEERLAALQIELLTG
jgi:hypothetical protein